MTPGVLIYPQGSCQYRAGDQRAGREVPVQPSATVPDVGQDPALRQGIHARQSVSRRWCPPGPHTPSPDSCWGERLGNGCLSPQRAAVVSPSSMNCLLGPLLPV